MLFDKLFDVHTSLPFSQTPVAFRKALELLITTMRQEIYTFCAFSMSYIDIWSASE